MPDFLLSQEQKQTQKLSPEMRQSLNILQMSSVDLADLIKKECEKNPTIEIDDQYYQFSNIARANEDFNSLENIASAQTLEEYLFNQIPDWNDKRKKIFRKLLEFIDPRGFFFGNLQVIACSTACSLEDVEDVYEELKLLHPCGIGARNLKECLLLQLNCSSNELSSLAKVLVAEHFDDLQKGKIKLLSVRLGVSSEKIIRAGKLVARLNFSPASEFGDVRNITIIPDIKIFKSGGKWTVETNQRFVPYLRFSKVYKEIGVLKNEINPETWFYLKQQANFGKKLSKAVNMRQETLKKISQSILSHQLDFFENGAEFMRPLSLGDVATEVGVHVSTVSRAVRNKYILTPHGMMPMVEFFDGTSKRAGNSLSRTVILTKIRELITSEGRKMTDRDISESLKKAGITVARRTVAKYRKFLHIPNSRNYAGNMFS